MTSELRRAAEAVEREAIADEPTGRWGISRLAMSDLRAALSAPDELAEARSIIAALYNNPTSERRQRAREFLKRTGTE